MLVSSLPGMTLMLMSASLKVGEIPLQIVILAAASGAPLRLHRHPLRVPTLAEIPHPSGVIVEQTRD